MSESLLGLNINLSSIVLSFKFPGKYPEVKYYKILPVNNTLRSAGRRGAIVARQAGANRALIRNTTLGIGTARGWVARVLGLGWRDYSG